MVYLWFLGNKYACLSLYGKVETLAKIRTISKIIIIYKWDTENGNCFILDCNELIICILK